MRFPMPRFPCGFEIPDDWLSEAGFSPQWRPTARAFRSSPDAVEVPLADIEPLYRQTSHQLDFRGFGRERMIRVLGEIVRGEVIYPAPAIELHGDLAFMPYRYRIGHGLHRYFASIAVGFSHIPCHL